MTWGGAGSICESFLSFLDKMEPNPDEKRTQFFISSPDFCYLNVFLVIRSKLKYFKYPFNTCKTGFWVYFCNGVTEKYFTRHASWTEQKVHPRYN